MTAIKWPNTLVMVFDDSGEQVLRLQGPYDEVKERCLAECDKFQHGINWRERTTIDVPKEKW